MKKSVIIFSAITSVVIIIIAVTVFASYDPSVNISDTESVIDLSNSTDESNATKPNSFTGWIINRLGYTYIFNDRALQQFNGTTKTAQNYSKTLNSIRKSTNANRAFSIIVPTQVEFTDIPISVMAEDNFYCTSQKESIFTSIASYNNIIPINITNLLFSHKDEYLYFRTDYNWTADAAYYAYLAFCDAAEIKPISLENYEKLELNNYLGWFYTATESEILLDNSDTIVYYRTEAEYPCYITVEQNGHKTYLLKYYGTEITSEKGYDVFIGKEKPLYSFETRSKGGSLLVVGDTSVHAFLPFLMPHYSEIFFYNPNCFDEKEKYTLPKTNDILFLSYATNANNPTYCKKMEGLLNNE